MAIYIKLARWDVERRDMSPTRVCQQCGGDPQPVENFNKDMTGNPITTCKTCCKKYREQKAKEKKEMRELMRII